MAVLTTLGLQQSIRQGWPLAWLAYIDHPDGEVWLWSGVGDLVYDGQTWQGVGEFGRVVNVGGAKQLAVRSLDFELTGIPDEAAQYLNKDIRGRSAKAWVAGMDHDGIGVNGSAWPVVDSIADYQELPIDDDGTVVVRISVTEPVYSIERAREDAWTSEWINEVYGPQDIEFSDPVTVFSAELASDDDSGTHNDGSVRQVFNLNGVGVLRHQIRARITSTTGGVTNIDNLSFGRQSAAWETQTVPDELLTAAASGLSVDAGASAFTDWLDFVFLDDDALVGVADLGGASAIRFLNLPFETYVKANDNTFNEASPAGFSGTNGPWLIDRIEARSIVRITALDLIPGLANASENWTLT